MKPISESKTTKDKAYYSVHESVRKDDERAFGVLKSRLHILKQPSWLWCMDEIAMVMRACIIFHSIFFAHRRDYNFSKLNSIMHCK